MKLLISFLILLMNALAQPEVGCLQVYNFLSEPVRFHTKHKALGVNALAPEGVSSAYLLNRGAHTIQLQIEGGNKLSYAVEIVRGETVILCLIDLYDVKAGNPNPRVLKLEPGKGRELSLWSLVDRDQKLSILGRELILKSREQTTVEGWDGRGFDLKIDGESRGKLEVEDRGVPHALVFWQQSAEQTRAELITQYRFAIPANLRDDFTYGRKREEIPGLKTLPPVE